MPLQRTASACITLTLFVYVILAGASYAQAAPRSSHKPASTGTHAYLLRGLLNVFSLGMDQLRQKLEARGIQATVHSHMWWSQLADEAIQDYKAGRVRHIVIMGHSAGAINAVDMANKIGSAGVPVSLVITFDPAFRTTVETTNVRHVINLYLPEGIGSKVYAVKGYRGVIENVDLKESTHHMTLDKSAAVQDRAIGYVLRYAKGPSEPEAPKHAVARAKNGKNGAASRQ